MQFGILENTPQGLKGRIRLGRVDHDLTVDAGRRDVSQMAVSLRRSSGPTATVVFRVSGYWASS